MTTPKLTKNGMAKDAQSELAAATAVKASKIRVLIADDHTVVREGLVAMIGKWTDMTVVAEAQNGREAVDQWKRHHPDVSLLDLRMPVLDGVGQSKTNRHLLVWCIREE